MLSLAMPSTPLAQGSECSSGQILTFFYDSSNGVQIIKVCPFSLYCCAFTPCAKT